jgi:hypothetical protein
VADTDWRSLERTWEAHRGDQDLLQRAIQARRRAGVAVSRRLLDGVVAPSRELSTRLPLEVWAVLPTGQVERVGETPRWLGRPLTIPSHRRWWVKPLSPLVDAGVGELVAELVELAVPGLELDARRLTDAGLEPLRGMTGLQTLIVKSGRHVTDGGVAHLRALGALENLYLWGCTAISDAGVASLSELQQLTSLQLPGSQLTDRGAEALSRLQRLTELGLTSSKITDAGLVHLGRLRGLAALDLDVCQRLTDAGLEALGGLDQLVKLNLLGCTGITDAGMVHLARLEQLRLLIVPALHGSRGVSDAGIAQVRAGARRCVVRQTWDAHAWEYYPWNS